MDQEMADMVAGHFIRRGAANLGLVALAACLAIPVSGILDLLLRGLGLAAGRSPVGDYVDWIALLFPYVVALGTVAAIPAVGVIMAMRTGSRAAATVLLTGIGGLGFAILAVLPSPSASLTSFLGAFVVGLPIWVISGALIRLPKAERIPPVSSS